MEKIAKATGGRIITNINDLNSESPGYTELIKSVRSVMTRWSEKILKKHLSQIIKRIDWKRLSKQTEPNFAK